MRSLEDAPPPPPADDALALATPPPPPPVSRAALVASLGVLLPVLREALHAVRLSSPLRKRAGVDGRRGESARGGEDDDALLALSDADSHLLSSAAAPFGGEVSPVRGFLSLQRPSPFEAAPRGPSVAGRRLRWVSHRVEICCPPSPAASYDLDGVFEDGASGVVGAYASVAQPAVRAALRGVSGHVVVVGDAAASASLALFGELAFANRIDGALAWAAGASRGAAGGARRCGLSGLMIAELLAEPARWLSGEHERELTETTAAWQVQCGAFQLTASGVVDLLEPPASDARHRALKEWSSAGGGVSGGTYAWPDDLTRVTVLSPFDFGEMLTLALGRRVALPTADGGAHVRSALPQPPVCAPTALVIDVAGTTPEGDATSAQIVLWDLPSAVAPPAPPPRVRAMPASVEGRAALAASLRDATVELRALGQGLTALRTVVELLGKPSAGGGSENEAAAGLAARGHPLTRLLWRALAGDCLTTCVSLASASEWHMPATLEAVQLTAAVRQLHTRPRARRVRAAPTLDDLAHLLDEVEGGGAAAAMDAVTESDHVAALAPEDWYDLPARLGYDTLLRELEQLAQLGAGAELEGAVLRKLVRRLLGTVRRLQHGAPPPPPKAPHQASASTPMSRPASPLARRAAEAMAQSPSDPASRAVAMQLAQERARAESAEATLLLQAGELKAKEDELSEAAAREAALLARRADLEKRLIERADEPAGAVGARTTTAPLGRRRRRRRRAAGRCSTRTGAAPRRRRVGRKVSSVARGAHTAADPLARILATPRRPHARRAIQCQHHPRATPHVAHQLVGLARGAAGPPA